MTTYILTVVNMVSDYMTFAYTERIATKAEWTREILDAFSPLTLSIREDLLGATTYSPPDSRVRVCVCVCLSTREYFNSFSKRGANMPKVTVPEHI